MWSHGLKRSGLHSEPQGAGFGGTLRVSHTGPRAGGRPVTEMGAPAQGHVPEADVACSPLGGRSRFPAWTPSRASAPAPHSPVVDAISDGREYSYLIRRQNPTGSSFLEASSHADSLGSSPASAGHQVCDLARVTLSLPASVSASPQRADRSSRLPGVLSGRSESKHLTHRLAMPLLCSLASPKCALHSALPGPPASGVFHAPPAPRDVFQVTDSLLGLHVLRPQPRWSDWQCLLSLLLSSPFLPSPHSARAPPALQLCRPGTLISRVASLACRVAVDPAQVIIVR